MKPIKRICCILLAAAMTVVLAAPFSTERAEAETAYFTAVNDTLFELSDATMPFWSGGNLYVPSTVFSSSDVGVSYAYGAGEKKAMLYRDNTALLFDLANGGVLTQNGVSYAFSAITKNGYVFFPGAFVCAYFTLSFTIIETDYIPLVRIKNSDATFKDSVFVSKADVFLSSRYNKYIQSKQTTSSDSGQQTDDSDDTPEETSKNSVTVCMAFTAGDSVSVILDRLSGYGFKAAFFFTADEMEGSDDLLRRIAAEGHTVGITVDGTISAARAEREIERANALLRTYTGAATRIILLSDGTYPKSALVSDGYCVFTANVDAQALGTTGASRAASVIKRIAAKKSYARVLMTGDGVSASALTTLLPRLREDKYSVRAVNEVNI